MVTELSTLVDNMMDVFSNAKAGGLVIVGGAIAIGIIFVTAIWLWGKLKKWLART